MSKDYAKKRRLLPRRSHPIHRSAAKEYIFMPAWAWMFAGLILGVLLSCIAYMKMHAKPQTVADHPVEFEESNPKQTAQENTKNKRMRFEFYTLLPNSNTEDPLPSTAQAEKPPQLADQELMNQQADLSPDEMPTLAPATEADPKKPQESYLIQVGSFRNLIQAEELKAQLAISGFEASVQTYKKFGNETLYRVYLGPFSSKEQAQQQQATIEQALQLQCLVIKNRV